MMVVRRSVGSLCEVVYAHPLGQEELTSFTMEVRRIVGLAAEPLVFCCDWRRVLSFDKTTADTIVWTMRRDNAKIAFNAVLLDPTNGVCRAQVEGILREAQNPRRKSFTDARVMKLALEPLLTEPEQARLEQFLVESSRGL